MESQATMGQVRPVRRVRQTRGRNLLLSLLILLSLVTFALGSFAFNSEEWLGKRELFAREAERLRAAYSNCVAHLEVPAENVTVPVETFEDGSVKVVISAEKAQYVLDSGLVWAEDVTVKKFKRDGTLDGQIDAKSCVVDRYSKSGWAEGPATVVHDKTTFKGRGVYFSSPESYVKVLEDAEIDSKDLKFGGLRP